MGGQAARGLGWMLLNAVGIKFFTVAGTIALAKLMLPAVQGPATQTLGLYAFALLLQQGGLREVLIQRGGRELKDEFAAVWLAAAQGLLSSLLMLAAAIPASLVFDSPKVAELMAILAIAPLLQGLALTSEVSLARNLRFRALAVLEGVRGVLVVLLSVALVWAGAGVYGIVLPIPIMAALRVICLWKLAPPRLSMSPGLARWKGFLGASTLVLAGSFLQTLMAQSGVLLLGVFSDDDAVAAYGLAFNFAIQAVILFGVSLSGVLLPVLSRLQGDKPRQLKGFLRSCRVLMFLGAPACLLQTALARPFVDALIDRPEWAPAIPVMEIVSVSMVFAMLWPVVRSFLQAQGRFKTAMLTITIYAVVFAIGAGFGAWYWGLIGTAWAVAILYSVTVPIETLIAIRPMGGGVKQVTTIYALPLLLAGVTVGAAFVLGRWWPERVLPDAPWRDWLVLGLVTAITGVIYPVLVRAFAPADWNELLDRLGSRMPVRLARVLRSRRGERAKAQAG